MRVPRVGRIAEGSKSGGAGKSRTALIARRSQKFQIEVPITVRQCAVNRPRRRFLIRRFRRGFASIKQDWTDTAITSLLRFPPSFQSGRKVTAGHRNSRSREVTKKSHRSHGSSR